MVHGLLADGARRGGDHGPWAMDHRNLEIPDKSMVHGLLSGTMDHGPWTIEIQRFPDKSMVQGP